MSGALATSKYRSPAPGKLQDETTPRAVDAAAAEAGGTAHDAMDAVAATRRDTRKIDNSLKPPTTRRAYDDAPSSSMPSVWAAVFSTSTRSRYFCTSLSSISLD